MKLHYKIRIIFIIAFVLLSASFSSYLYIQKSEHLQKNEKRYMQISRFALEFFRNNRHLENDKGFKDTNFNLFLKDNSFEFISAVQSSEILKNAISIKTNTRKRVQIEILKYKRDFYLYLKHPKINILLKDKEEKIFPRFTLLFYLLSLLFLLGLYFWIMQSLKPLKTLHQSIQKVESGDLSISFKSRKNDEIAMVSNAFDNALRKIESLISSRQLFLRTIMHELKTPIGKGKLLNEFLENSKQKEAYEMVFERLELLIEEFSKIEQMLSSSYQLKLSSYNVQEMIDQALELMIMDEKEIEEKVSIIQVEPFVLKTDFELFSLALKNLIDNALKYSPNHHININVYKDRIELSSQGVQFTTDLNEYTQPFNPKGQGLGLGLYIVHNIMKLLKLNINYSYIKESNTFILTA